MLVNRMLGSLTTRDNNSQIRSWRKKNGLNWVHLGPLGSTENQCYNYNRILLYRNEGVLDIGTIDT